MIHEWLFFDATAVYMVVVSLATPPEYRHAALERWLQLIASYTRIPGSSDAVDGSEPIPVVILVATNTDNPIDADSACHQGKTTMSPWAIRELRELTAEFAGRLLVSSFIALNALDPGSLEMEELRMDLRRGRDHWMTHRGGVLGYCAPALQRLPAIRASHGPLVPRKVGGMGGMGGGVVVVLWKKGRIITVLCSHVCSSSSCCCCWYSCCC